MWAGQPSPAQQPYQQLHQQNAQYANTMEAQHSRVSSTSSHGDQQQPDQQQQQKQFQAYNPYDAHQSYISMAQPQQQQYQDMAYQPPPPQQHMSQQHPPSFASSTAMPSFDAFAAMHYPGAAGDVYDMEDPQGTKHTAEATAAENPATEPEQELPPPVKEHRRRRLIFWGLRYFLVAIVVAVLLIVPMIVNQNDADIDLLDAGAVKRQKRGQTTFFTFLWIMTSFVGFILADLLGLALPYIFRFISRYVNTAHQKYWRFLRSMRRPISILGGVIVTYISFAGFIKLNDNLAINIKKVDAEGQPLDNVWTFIIDDILEQCTLWAAFYVLEKIMILYISIHYHYRGSHTKITRSKEMMNALITMYEASLHLHPHNVENGPFAHDDAVIRSATGREYSSGRTSATSYLSRLGVDTYSMANFFGDFMSDDPKSHWLRPASTYATVERCIANPRAAAALARRIWVSLAVGGSEVLTAQDLVEVLGPYRRDEAVRAFATVAMDGSVDVRLDEFVMAVVEAGKIRHDVYQAMHSADHCINTFDWICILILAAVMVFFIMLIYVPSIKDIQQQVSVIMVGLSFAAGRVVHHFLIGVVYVFFDHPFDEGDVVQVYNLSSMNRTACRVKRVSLLYTVFRRLDDGSDMQIQNQQLVMKRVENITRSGNNKQSLTLFVEAKTTFTDLLFLRRELEAFVKSEENRRDFMPEVGCWLVGVHELNKLELRCVVSHRSNWSNERLRAARSNKFYCAVLAAARKIPLNKPGGPMLLGDPGRPMYTARLDEEAAGRLVKKDQETRKKARVDFEEEEAQGEEEREKQDKARMDKEKTAEAERAALATLGRAGETERERERQRFMGASTAVEVGEYMGRGVLGMRVKR